jgi:hypothetical protein
MTALLVGFFLLGAASGTLVTRIARRAGKDVRSRGSAGRSFLSGRRDVGCGEFKWRAEAGSVFVRLGTRTIESAVGHHGEL